MTELLTPEQDWAAFREEVGEILRLPVASVTPAAVVGVDIDVDSLALSELTAFFYERYGVDLVDESQATFAGQSLGQLHQRLRAG